LSVPHDGTVICLAAAALVEIGAASRGCMMADPYNRAVGRETLTAA